MNILTDYDAFTTEYDELQTLAQMSPIPQTRPNITYETLRNHYKPLSLRERVEIQRHKEKAKHAAQYGNRTAAKGLEMLEKARKEAEQPKQLRLF